MPITTNLYVDQGADYKTGITVQEDDGAALDLNDYTIRGQIRKFYGTSKYYDITIAPVNLTEGTFNIIIPSTVSNQMTPGRWLYDIEIKHKVSNEVTRIMNGAIELSGQITLDPTEEEPVEYPN